MDRFLWYTPRARHPATWGLFRVWQHGSCGSRLPPPVSLGVLEGPASPPRRLLSMHMLRMSAACSTPLPRPCRRRRSLHRA